MMWRREQVWLVGLTLVGALARGFCLDAQSLWLDELFSVFLARREVNAILAGTAQDTMPPLYYLFLHIALQFGSDEIAARSVSFLFGVATIPLFYFFARRLFDGRVALIASALFVASPFQIMFAQEARMYAQLTFFSLAAMFFFWCAWQGGRGQDWLFFVVFETLAFYSHSLAFLNLLALDVFGLTQRAQLREHWRALVFAHLAIAILFAPWLVVLFQQAMRVQAGFWGVTPSPLVLLTTPYLFLFGNVVPLFIVPFALFITLALLGFSGLAIRRALTAGQSARVGLVFALIVFSVPVLVLYSISLFRPMYVERTLIVASFGLYIWLAWTIVRATPRTLFRVMGGLLLAIMVAVLPNYYFNPDVQKPPMREAARTLVAQVQPGDVVVHTSDSSALAFMYYAPQLPNYFLAGDPDYVNETTRGRSGRIAGLEPRELSALVVDHTRVWLVVALDHNEEYQRARVQEFDVRYRREELIQVGKIALVRYGVGR